MKIGSAISVGLVGMKAYTIRVQAFISSGLPYFSIIGLPDASLGEARERVRSAAMAAGFDWPQTRVTVNLSPASVPKRGSSHDLAIAAAVLESAGVIKEAAMEDTLLLGELNLDGSVSPVRGLLPILLHARAQGIRKAVVPAANMDEAALVPDVEASPVAHLAQFIMMMGGKADMRVPVCAQPAPDGVGHEARLGVRGPDEEPDMAQVIGQGQAKWALEVAAAGGHHVLMTGPPGSGKTMLASRMPSILAPLDDEEALEVASIRSICGTLPLHGVTRVPPFEAPHHTASPAALVGGGSALAQPGAITRAHRGVLFMDEAPEFAPRALQALREPLETGHVTVTRSRYMTNYPARFQLVMAANPCPCGMAFGMGERCTCTPMQIRRYFGRISGPLLDRIDIQVAVPPVQSLREPQGAEEASATIRARVCEARERARRRFSHWGWSSNAQASTQWLFDHADGATMGMLSRAMDDGRMSARGAGRTMRLAWTIADMDGRDGGPGVDDVHRALSLRTRLHDEWR